MKTKSGQEIKFNRKWVLLALLCLAALIVLIIVFGRPLYTRLSDPQRLREYLLDKGRMANFTFFLLVLLQVLSGFFPAGPLQLASGYLYGTLLGCVLYDLYAALGSTIAFLLGRSLGSRLIDKIIEGDPPALPTEKMTVSQARNFLFLIYLIPGTPKDFAPYIVGIGGRISLPWLLLSTIVGRILSIVLTVMVGDSFASGNAVIIIVCCIVAIAANVIGKSIYDRKTGKNNS